MDQIEYAHLQRSDLDGQGWTYSDDLLVRLRVFGQGGKDEARFRCRHLSRQAQARDLMGEINARKG